MASKNAPQAIATETMTTERMSTGAMLARLVAFDTTSRNPNTGLIDFIRAWLDAEARRFAATGPFDANFDPPHTTVHVGTFQGGAILNIIPERCEFTMEWRTIPTDDFFAHVERLRAHVAATIEPAMKAVDPGCGFTLDVMNWIPGLRLPGEHALADLVKQVTGANATFYVSYGTEGGLYEQAGIPTIVCGPGAIAQAHQPDEWIAQSQLDACDAFIRRLADRLAG